MVWYFASSSVSKKIVKCTLVQTLRLCTGHTAHKERRGIALPFLAHGTKRGEGSASRPSGSLPPGKTWYPLYRRTGGPQGWSGQVGKISSPTGIRSLDLPARSQSLYRLHYPAHKQLYTYYNHLPTLSPAAVAIIFDKTSAMLDRIFGSDFELSSKCDISVSTTV
jgi:hypothetical protein